MVTSDSSKPPLRILIVDDDDIDRMAVQRALKKTGLEFHCTEACDAKTAVTRSREERFDLAFLDYVLPDKDGLSLLKLLQLDGMKGPIIMLTGQGNESVVVDLMKAGAADYLNKADITAERLKRCIRGAIRLYEAEETARVAAQELEVRNALLRQRNQELEDHRRRIEAQNNQLLEAARLKSEFIATISHELRTPMNSILGFSQVLERQSHGKLSDYQLNMIGRILTNAQHLMSLISDLLDFSKAEAGHITLQREPVNFSQLVAGVVGDMTQRAQEKGLSLNLEDELKEPLFYGDGTRIRQIVVNLLSNATKFTAQGGVQVHLREIINPQGTAQVQLQVQDSGIGIAPQSQRFIFDNFRQVNQTDTRAQGGTGLGLAIVKALVDLMGGTIEVESQLGEGAKFTVNLPRNQ